MLSAPIDSLATRRLREWAQDGARPVPVEQLGYAAGEREAASDVILRVRDTLGLRCSTTFCAISYYDRLPCELRGKAAAAACAMVASKFNGVDEACCPGAYERALNNEVTHEELRAAELALLAALEWRLHVVSPHAFLEQLAFAFKASVAVQVYAAELITKSMTDPKLPSFEPAVVAASAMLCAWMQLEKPSLGAQLGRALGFSSCHVSVQDLNNCMPVLAAYL